MTDPAAPAALTGHLALLSSISFGGFPTVLPDVHHYVVTAHGWLTDRQFANFFAIVQSVPGPNMILMMSLIGWQVWGLPGAAASAAATFVPPCIMYFTAYRFWHRREAAAWQAVVRRGLVPVTIGLVIAGGVVMARAADTGWRTAAVSAGAAGLMLLARISPLWLLAGGAALGGAGAL